MNRKCPTCVEHGTRSRLYVNEGSVTLMATHDYYDENGDYHFHNPNTQAMSISCSLGHWGAFNEGFPCWCGWPKTDTDKNDEGEEE